MNVICENCKAPYTDTIYPHTKLVKCPYCKGTIKVVNQESKITKRVVIEEVIPEPAPSFSVKTFCSFLGRRGIKNYDPVSGVIKIGNQMVVVNEDGTISGSEPLKSRVEKWVQSFMSQT